MFQVNRFDPSQDPDRTKQKSKRRVASVDELVSQAQKKKKKSKQHGALKEGGAEATDTRKAQRHKDTPSLKVIAPDEGKEGSSRVSKAKSFDLKTSEEAFDDLDIDETLDDNDKNEEEGPISEDENDNGPIDPNDELQIALRMSKQSIAEAAKAWNLAPFLVDNLTADGYTSFFPIQSLVIPNVIAADRHDSIQARDICVAAPTGSGKTLAFVLPILNSLSNRRIRRLRALVVLPSRDLAMQVHSVFERYCEGSDLKVGLAIGQTDFQTEQKKLTIGDDSDQRCFHGGLESLKASYDIANIELALDAFDYQYDNNTSSSSQLPLAGISAVDVLVCTPGRLVDHLDNTPGFTLSHLRYLVIDEADRLLSQSYHGWIGRVLNGAKSASVAAWHNQSQGNGSNPSVLKESSDGTSFILDPITWRRREATDGHENHNTDETNKGPANPRANAPLQSSVLESVTRPVQLRKLLYSATMTKDPQKLAALRLVNPKQYDVGRHKKATAKKERNLLYTMPDQLCEFTVECTAQQKPIVLLALLLGRIRREESSEKKAGESTIIVVFTASLESTHRLTRLLQLLWISGGYGPASRIAEFSSSLNQSQRSNLMARCNGTAEKDDPVSVVVCSDGMSRGMDIAHVETVINYDVPGFAKTYVHRCGRTARAGRDGDAISLLKGGQVRAFQKLRHLITDSQRVQKMQAPINLVRDAVPIYKRSVVTLKRLLQAEEDGELNFVDNRLESWLSKGREENERIGEDEGSQSSSSYYSSEESEQD